MKLSRFFALNSIIFIAAAYGLAAPPPAVAAERVWTGNGNDRLASNALNWEGATAPVSGEALNFPSGASVVWDLAGVVPSSAAVSANVSLSAPLTVSGKLDIADGRIELNSQALNVGGDFTLNGGILESGGSAISVSGSWIYRSGTANFSANTVTLAGAANKTITSGGMPFGNLTIASAGSMVTAADDLAVNGTLTVADGTLQMGSKTLTVTGSANMSGGALSLQGGKLVLTGTSGLPLVVGNGVFSASQDSTVEYRPISGSVSIASGNYGDLELMGNALFSLSGDATVGGVLKIGAGATFSVAGHSFNVPNGTIANGGRIAEGTIRCPLLSMHVLDSAGNELSAIKSASGTVRIRVEDQDLNRQGSAADTVPSSVLLTTLAGDRESVTLQETGASTGIFMSSDIVLHQNKPITGNGQLELGQNDIAFFAYADPQDGSDAKTLQLTSNVSAEVTDGQPQIVLGPQISDWSSVNTGSSVTYSAHVKWNTDIVSTSAVTVTSPQITAPISTGNLTGTTDHDVLVTGLVRGRAYSFTVTSVSADGKSVVSSARDFRVIVSGDRIKSAQSAAVYWYLDGKRNVFPDFTAYDSWFSDWNGIVTVPNDQLASIPLGKIVPVRAGTYLVKIQSDPKTYAVEPYGKLRWIQSEAQAIALYGNEWSKRVRDVDVSQFVGYAVGDPLPAGGLPSGYVFKTPGGDMNGVIDGVSHALSETARKMNGISNRFVASVTASFSAGMTGSPTVGYEPDFNGVLADGSRRISAPAVAD
jgi:hypothetical protein